MSLETSVSERGEKEVRDCVFVVMKLLLVCGVRNWSLMFFVLFVKKVAKSSAVRVDEGGGGGGQRREENVLKSARESELGLHDIGKNSHCDIFVFLQYILRYEEEKKNKKKNR